MKKRKRGIFGVGLVLFVSCFLVFSAPVMASTIVDFVIPGGTGSINYYADGTFEGSGIGVAYVFMTGPGASTNLNASLEFGMTADPDGKFTNGYISITDTYWGDLLYGEVLSGEIDVTSNEVTFSLTWADFSDEKKEALFTALGFNSTEAEYWSSLTWIGQLNLSWNSADAVWDENGNWNISTVGSGDVMNSPVPLPPSALLMGSGLVGLLGFGLRRRLRAGS